MNLYDRFRNLYSTFSHENDENSIFPCLLFYVNENLFFRKFSIRSFCSYFFLFVHDFIQIFILILIFLLNFTVIFVLNIILISIFIIVFLTNVRVKICIRI